jgi:hypothetical protein
MHGLNIEGEMKVYSVEIIKESGFEEAMLGLSLSYNKKFNLDEMYKVASMLYHKDSGHNKFLESMQVWIDINMPRYWWSEFDTYRVGVTKQSESTMHTVTKKDLTQDDFISVIPSDLLQKLNELITLYAITSDYKDIIFREIKSLLPEGFMQRRVVSLNYKVLRHMIKQRKNHRLIEWQDFTRFLQKNCEYKKFLE